MNQYLDTLRHIRQHGKTKTDRTGTGTLSLFGQQMRFDLSAGFPLVTTKQMFTRGAVEELLWFISGSTDVNVLKDKGVNFWNSWVYEFDGTIGHGYGRQLRSKEQVVSVTPRLYVAPATLGDSKEPRTVFGVGYYGEEDFREPHREMLVNAWREMLRRCYNTEAKAYPGYGGRGVHVHSDWHCFATFQRDAKKLPGWALKVCYPEEFSLDKDVLWASNRYGKDTCMWASEREQNLNKSNTTPFFATSPEGERVLFGSIGEASRHYSMNVSAVHRCLNGDLHTHHGWSEFTRVPAEPGQVLRFRVIDQLKSVLAGLKVTPDSRRHLISLWDYGDADRTTLPPCHGTAIQFDVTDGKLSCLMYQRSADMFLGVPVNIASYALLTHMLAQECNLEVGEFIWTGGDCHIYSNHLEQVDLQLSRQPLALPKLLLDKPADIFSFKPENIALDGYQHHPAIKAPVAI